MSVGRVGSLGFAFLILFRSFIFEVMVSGSGVWFDLILPFGMWCLSAVRMALVSVVLAVWGFLRFVVWTLFRMKSLSSWLCCSWCRCYGFG